MWQPLQLGTQGKGALSWRLGKLRAAKGEGASKALLVSSPKAISIREAPLPTGQQ